MSQQTFLPAQETRNQRLAEACRAEGSEIWKIVPLRVVRVQLRVRILP